MAALNKAAILFMNKTYCFTKMVSGIKILLLKFKPQLYCKNYILNKAAIQIIW